MWNYHVTDCKFYFTTTVQNLQLNITSMSRKLVDSPGLGVGLPRTYQATWLFPNRSSQRLQVLCPFQPWRHERTPRHSPSLQTAQPRTEIRTRSQESAGCHRSHLARLKFFNREEYMIRLLKNPKMTQSRDCLMWNVHEIFSHWDFNRGLLKQVKPSRLNGTPEGLRAHVLIHSRLNQGTS